MLANTVLTFSSDVSSTNIFIRAKAKKATCIAPKAGRAKKVAKQAVWPKKTAPGKASPKKKTGRSVSGLDSGGLDTITQLQRRMPFGAHLPTIEDTPAANLARINQILNDRGTTA